MSIQHVPAARTATLEGGCGSLGDGGALLPAVYSPRWSFRWFVAGVLRRWNKIRRAVAVPAPVRPTASVHLAAVRDLAAVPSDINEHLEVMFAEGLLCRPKLIVELGVRGGVSSFVLDRVAHVCGASVIGVDIDDCSSAYAGEQRFFVQGDDVQFASSFAEFCRLRGLAPVVDLLFIDTSHYYEHTVQEIAAWFPLLSTSGRVMFHDTNMRLVGPRKDGCIEISWDNERGVIRALEEYFGITVDENKEYIDFAKGYLIRHWPNCNGLTIADRVSVG